MVGYEWFSLVGLYSLIFTVYVQNLSDRVNSLKSLQKIQAPQRIPTPT